MKAKISALLGKLFGSGVDFTEEASLPDIPKEGDLRYAAKLAKAARDKADANQSTPREDATGKDD